MGGNPRRPSAVALRPRTRTKVVHWIPRSSRRKKLLRLSERCRLLRPASHKPGDFDCSASFHIHHEPVSLKHSHAQQQSRLRDIHGDASRTTIPDHGSVVHVKENFVAIRQQCGTASPPSQRQLFDKLRRKRQPSIESGIDNRVDFQFVAGRTSDSDLNDASRFAVTCPSIMSAPFDAPLRSAVNAAIRLSASKFERSGHAPPTDPSRRSHPHRLRKPR